MKNWRPLKKNDLVDVIAPAWATTSDELQLGLKYLENIGLRARVSENIFGEDLLCANTDQARAQDLKKALYAKDSAAVWCLRGGYGALRLMPEIIKWKAPLKAKLFIGYSDITTLHHWFNTKWKWSTLHGPLLDRMGSNRCSDEERKEVESLIFGNEKQLIFPELEALGKKPTKLKKISGQILGGNLSVITSAIGTPHQLKARGKILFFEDWGERAYRLDRMMQQFHQSKTLDGVKAIVLGDFLGGQDKDGQTRVWPFWNEFADARKIPVFRGLPVGHGERQRSLPLGETANLKFEKGAWSMSVSSGHAKK